MSCCRSSLEKYSVATLAGVGWLASLVPFRVDEVILANGEEGLRLDEVLRKGEVLEVEGVRPFKLGKDLLLLRVGDVDCPGEESGLDEL